MLRFLLVVVLMALIFKDRISNYTNYVDYQQSFQDMNVNCPSVHNKNYEKITQQPSTIQLFGYTDNEYLDKTRFLVTDQPLPTDPDFFM
mgnify:CR=1 FL=1